MGIRWFNIQPELNSFQKLALERAKKISGRYPKDTMFCPFCGSPLIPSGEERKLTTMSEHMSDTEPSAKYVYVCANKFSHIQDCKCGKLYEWLKSICNGSHYASEFRKKICKKRDEYDFDLEVYYKLISECFDMNQAALNSVARQESIELYGYGLPTCISLPSWLTFNKIQLYVEFHYQANLWGEVEKTHISLEYMKKDNLTGDFSIKGTFPWTIWESNHKQSKYALEELDDMNMSDSRRVELLEELFGIYYNKSISFKLYTAWMKLWHPIYYKELVSLTSKTNS